MMKKRQSKEGSIKRRTFLKTVGGVAAALPLSAGPWVITPARAQKKILRWWVSPPGGPWYAMATAISETVKQRTGEILELHTGGGVINPVAINRGEGDIGFTGTEVLASAWQGEDIFKVYPWKKPLQNFRQLFLLSPSFLHVAVWADSKAQTIDDLKGLRVDSQPVGFSAEAQFHWVVKAHGMTYKDMKISRLVMRDGILAMKDGHLDAFMLTSPFPAGLFIDLATFKPIRLLAVRKEIMDKMVKLNKGLIPGTITAGAYRGHTKDVLVPRSDLVIFCRKDLPTDQMYKVTKSYVENLDRMAKTFAYFKGLTGKNVAQTRGVPLHPGAEKYYKEAGYI